MIKQSYEFFIVFLMTKRGNNPIIKRFIYIFNCIFYPNRYMT